MKKPPQYRIEKETNSVTKECIYIIQRKTRLRWIDCYVRRDIYSSERALFDTEGKAQCLINSWIESNGWNK